MSLGELFWAWCLGFLLCIPVGMPSVGISMEDGKVEQALRFMTAWIFWPISLLVLLVAGVFFWLRLVQWPSFRKKKLSLDEIDRMAKEVLEELEKLNEVSRGK